MDIMYTVTYEYVTYLLITMVVGTIRFWSRLGTDILDNKYLFYYSRNWLYFQCISRRFERLKN